MGCRSMWFHQPLCKSSDRNYSPGKPTPLSAAWRVRPLRILPPSLQLEDDRNRDLRIDRLAVALARLERQAANDAFYRRVEAREAAALRHADRASLAVGRNRDRRDDAAFLAEAARRRRVTGRDGRTDAVAARLETCRGDLHLACGRLRLGARRFRYLSRDRVRGPLGSRKLDQLRLHDRRRDVHGRWRRRFVEVLRRWRRRGKVHDRVILDELDARAHETLLEGPEENEVQDDDGDEDRHPAG